MKKDRDILIVILRAFKNKDISSEEALEYVMNTYRNSRMFNWNNFALGMFAMMFAMIVAMSIKELIKCL